MLKLIKYEFRKNITPVLIFLGILAVFEIYFLVSYNNRNDEHIALAILGLILTASIAYFVVLALGISSYSKELKNKTIYLIFMTPNSTISIILSKLIHVAITALIVALIFVGLGVWDIQLYANMLTESSFSAFDVLDIVLQSYNMSLSSLIASLIGLTICSLIVFLTYVVMGYLSITLSATLLSNSKGKGFLSVVFYVVLFVINIFVIDALPKIGEYPETIADYVYQRLPQTIFELIFMVIMVWATAYLLDKKISL
jgi:hypothetical protein